MTTKKIWHQNWSTSKIQKKQHLKTKASEKDAESLNLKPNQMKLCDSKRAAFKNWLSKKKRWIKKSYHISVEVRSFQGQADFLNRSQTWLNSNKVN